MRSMLAVPPRAVVGCSRSHRFATRNLASRTLSCLLSAAASLSVAGCGDTDGTPDAGADSSAAGRTGSGGGPASIAGRDSPDATIAGSGGNAAAGADASAAGDPSVGLGGLDGGGATDAAAGSGAAAGAGGMGGSADSGGPTDAVAPAPPDATAGCLRDQDCPRPGDRCVQGACVAQLCTPGARECQDAQTVRECRNDGSAWTSRNCPLTSACVTGLCRTVICTPNTAMCVNDSTLSSCNATGTKRTTGPCPSGERCFADRCQKPVCTPDARMCIDDRNLRVCSANGSETRIMPCAQAERCVHQACVPPGCWRHQLAGDGFLATAEGAQPRGWLAACMDSRPYEWAVGTDPGGNKHLRIDFRGGSADAHAAVGIPVAWPGQGVAFVQFRARAAQVDQNLRVLAVRSGQRQFDGVVFRSDGTLPGFGGSYQVNEWVWFVYQVDFDMGSWLMWARGSLIAQGPLQQSGLPCSLPADNHLSVHGGGTDEKGAIDLDYVLVTHRTTECPPDKALLFQAGQGSAVVMGTAGLFPQEVTYETWVQFDNLQETREQIVLMAEDSGSRNFYLRLHEGSLRCDFGNGTSGSTSAGIPQQTVLQHTLNHVACTRDGNELALWLNGAKKAAVANPGPYSPPSGPFRMGARATGPALFEGILDGVRVSAGARYTDNFVPTRDPKSDASTLALWTFDTVDAANPSLASDVSGNGHGAQLTGVALRTWVR